MDYVHHCVMCGWQRPAASPTVTPPRCETCGCAMESAHTEDLPTVDGRAQGIVVPEGVRTAVLRGGAIVGTGLLMVAAALTGYTAGGLAIAVTAVGVAGLFVVMAMAAERA